MLVSYGYCTHACGTRAKSCSCSIEISDMYVYIYICGRTSSYMLMLGGT